MRRSDKEIKNQKMIEWILQEAEIVRVSFSDDNQPYLVPMNFGYGENCIYLHSAPEGRKIDILKKNNRVCFQVDVHAQIVENATPCNWGMHYFSVIGVGRAYFLDKIKDKKDSLDVIMKKYSSNSSFNYSEEELKSVTVIKIEIDQLTGKKSGP